MILPPRSRTRGSAPWPVPCRAVLALLTLSTLAFAPATAPNPARNLLTLARQEFEDCQSDACKDFGSDVWQLRKRLATTEELRSMAVQVEQGDDACLCGNKSPTVVAIDRQAQMLAEATLLFHLAGDRDGTAYNASRLRNIAAKEPGNLVVDELLVRTLALTQGADASLREVATIDYAVPRIHILVSAADTRALSPDAKRKLVGDAFTTWSGASDADKTRMAVPLARALGRAGMTAEADTLMTSLKDASLREQAKAAARVTPPSTARAENPVSPAARAAALVESYANPREVLAVFSSITDNRSYTISRTGELAAARANPARLLAISTALPPGPDRLTFLLGAIRGMTKASDRTVYEDVLITHPYNP